MVPGLPFRHGERRPAPLALLRRRRRGAPLRAGGHPAAHVGAAVVTAHPRARSRARPGAVRALEPQRHVPLDQSGAVAAARWIARSGWREARARVSRVSRVENTNASAFDRCRPPRPATRGRRGRRAPSTRTVAQQHEPAAGDAPAPAGQANRIASRAQAGAERPTQVDVPAVTAPAVAARVPHRGGDLQTRHQPVQPGELVRVEGIEALAGQPLLVAGRGQRERDLALGLVAAGARAGRRATRPAGTSPGALA